MSSKGKRLEERGKNICRLTILSVSPVTLEKENKESEPEKEDEKKIEQVDSNVNRGASIMEQFSKSKHPSSDQ
tara:strand:- start:4379 stop:4597 length:219 start_codon:yes stop_codon:yes gene_type:complete